MLRALRRLRAWLVWALDLGIAWALNGLPRVRLRVAGQQSLHHARRVAVLVHWDQRSKVHDYVVNYAKCLHEAGCAVIFATSCKRLLATEIDRILPFVALTLFRTNRGYDFGAYNDAIREIPDLQGLECLLLVNDSVYGPFQDLRPILAKCDDSADVWGLTDSWDRYWHLQSYFLLFRRTALRSKVFQRFWAKMLFCDNKEYVITRHEIGLSQRLVRAGLRMEAIYPYEQARSIYLQKLTKPRRKNEDPSALTTQLAKAGTPLNATHHYWDILISKLKYPFIKRDLLTGNSQRIENLIGWRALVGKVSNYDISLIDRHLRSFVRNRAP